MAQAPKKPKEQAYSRMLCSVMFALQKNHYNYYQEFTTIDRQRTSCVARRDFETIIKKMDPAIPTNEVQEIFAYNQDSTYREPVFKYNLFCDRLLKTKNVWYKVGQFFEKVGDFLDKQYREVNKLSDQIDRYFEYHKVSASRTDIPHGVLWDMISGSRIEI
jgi:hypothetical protein